MDTNALIERRVSESAEKSIDEMLDVNTMLHPETQVKRFKGRNMPSLEPIKEEIRMARKSRVRTVEQYLCDNCDAVITDPSSGFVIHGNIYVADPSQVGGLVGDNFPTTNNGTIEFSQIKKTVMCKACFLKALGLITSGVRDASRSNL